MRIYLIRHGETIWNVERRYQGVMDSPLSALGRAQAVRTRDALRAAPLRAVYSSPLRRALDCASLIADAHGLPVIPVGAFSEIRLGEWEGLLVSQVDERYAEVARQWHATPHLARIPGGETIEQLRKRAVAGFDAIRGRHDGEAVAIVAHGGVNKTILLTILGAPLAAYWRIRQMNGCVNVLECEGDQVRVPVLNETAHLAGIS